MRPKTHTKAPRRPRLALRLMPQDEVLLRELRAALTNEAGSPSYADVIRLAIREAHTARTKKGQA